MYTRSQSCIHAVLWVRVGVSARLILFAFSQGDPHKTYASWHNDIASSSDWSWGQHAVRNRPNISLVQGLAFNFAASLRFLDVFTSQRHRIQTHPSTRQAMLNAKILAETATSEPPETHEFSQGGMGRCSTWDTRYPTNVCLHALALALSLVISFMFCVPWRQCMMNDEGRLSASIQQQQGDIPVQWTWFSLQNIIYQRKL